MRACQWQGKAPSGSAKCRLPDIWTRIGGTSRTVRYRCSPYPSPMSRSTVMGELAVAAIVHLGDIVVDVKGAQRVLRQLIAPKHPLTHLM